MTNTPTGRHADQRGTDWSADKLAALIRYESARLREERQGAVAAAESDHLPTGAAPRSHVDTSRRTFTINELSVADHESFVDTAYFALLGRAPTSDERWRATSRLLHGDHKTAILGELRYGSEGGARGVRVRGLLPRHLAQRAFRLPLVGYVLEWLAALLKLPGALRFARSSAQSQAGSAAGIAAELAKAVADTTAQLAQHGQELERTHAQTLDLAESIAAISAQLAQRGKEIERLRAEGAAALAEVHVIAEWVRPTGLPATLEIASNPLVRPMAALGAGEPLPPPDIRYAEFERVFYESHVVARKQRVYLPFIDRGVASLYPFLDLGCGRGEFMEILRGEGIRSVGIDINSGNVAGLKRMGHEVHEGDLLTFLDNDMGTYSGAVCLQVVEHMQASQFERMLELLHPRLASGALVVIESVNPHCPFALGNFHMDPTHVAPVPPERVRFYMELAGFQNTRTLLQAPIPESAFGGPDPRAHYCDYAVIGYRS